MRRPFHVKGRKGWHAEYKFADGQVQRRTFDEFAQAEQWLAQKKAEDDAEQGPLFGGPERITLGQFLGEYAARFSIAKLGCHAELNRINHYVRAAGLPALKVVCDEHGRRRLVTERQAQELPSAFAAHKHQRLQLREDTYAWLARLARKRVAQVTTDDIRMLMTTGKREGWSDSTIQKEVALLKSAFNSAIREWRWKGFANPCLGLKLGKSNRRFVVMTQAQLDRMVQALAQCDNPQFWPLVDLAIHTTMRVDSLLSLRWSRIDLETRHARVWAKGKWVDAQLPPRAVDILRNLPRGAGDEVFTMSRNAVDLAWEGVRDRANLPGMTFRDLRHVGATAYAKAGLLPHELKHLLGHTTTRMAEVYVNLANSDVLAALDAAHEKVKALTPMPPTRHAHGMSKHPRSRKAQQAVGRAEVPSNVLHVARAADGKLTLAPAAVAAPSQDVEALPAARRQA